MGNNPRTPARFKYRNAAVIQGTILGLEKLVLITCAEFAHDDGTFWHSYKSLAAATGVSQGKVYKCVQSLISRGVMKIVRKGHGRRVSNKYQIVLENLVLKPSVYDLPKLNRSPHERIEPEQLSADEGASEAEVAAIVHHMNESNPIRSPRERHSFTTRTEDIDFDVDLPIQDGDLKAKAPLKHLNENLGGQGQSQNPVTKPQDVDVVPKHKAQAVGMEAGSSNGGSKPLGSASPVRLCHDCGKRPVWQGRWCDHCHMDGPHAR